MDLKEEDESDDSVVLSGSQTSDSDGESAANYELSPDSDDTEEDSGEQGAGTDAQTDAEMSDSDEQGAQTDAEMDDSGEQAAETDDSQDEPHPQSEGTGGILPDSRLELYEQVALGAILISLSLPAIGFLLGWLADFWVIWDVFDVNIIQPIVGEGGGDSSYNPVDTAAYAILLVSFIVTLSALFRRLNIDSSDRMVYSLLPWVAWAVLVEVHEDASLFDAAVDQLFVSPIIHFQTAAWVVLCGILVSIVAKKVERPRNGGVTLSLLPTIVVLISHILLFYDLSMVEILAFIIIVPSMILWSEKGEPWQNPVRNWGDLEKSLLHAGIAACTLTSYSLFGFALEQSAADELTLWPAFVVLIFPLVFISMLYHRGRDAYAEVISSGRIPGILDSGVTLKEWEGRSGEEHEEFERLTRRAAFATPLAMLAVYGHLVDGLASWVGVDIFGYSEKHVLSEWVMRLSGGGDGGSGGGWGFFVVKFALSFVIIMFFAEWRFEQRQRHLRLLIVLGLLSVGLAPGLRDLGRLMLGV